MHFKSSVSVDIKYFGKALEKHAKLNGCASRFLKNISWPVEFAYSIAKWWYMKGIFDICFKTGSADDVVALSLFIPVITDVPYGIRTFKFVNSFLI